MPRSAETGCPASPSLPPGYSYPATAALFILGGVVTAVFSGSLVKLARNADLKEVLTVGMIVPSFTWVVQILASGGLMSGRSRRLYWGDLGRICLLGSLALLPAALVNLALPDPPLWLSAANVLASVGLMAVDLFRRAARHGIVVWWPISWCLTITVNMTLFVLASWRWW